MGKQEIKTEINKALDKIPEEVLSQVLEILKQFHKDSSKTSLLLNLSKIINEDDELLRKLAQ